MKINTGDLIKQLRSEEMAEAPRASKAAMVRQRSAAGYPWRGRGGVGRVSVLGMGGAKRLHGLALCVASVYMFPRSRRTQQRPSTPPLTHAMHPPTHPP